MAVNTPQPTRADYRAFYALQTRWIDNDIYGHMNNVVHYSLFDTAVNGWLMNQGLLDPHTSPSYGLVVKTGCEYHAEMAFPDRVTAGLRVAKLGTSSVTFEVALFRNDDERAAATGHFVHVYVDRATHRPVAIEGARRAAFESILHVAGL
jgi:acyl-CoA thioester hydrolase